MVPGPALSAAAPFGIQLRPDLSLSRSQTRALGNDLDKHFHKSIYPCSVCVIKIYKLRTLGPTRWVYAEKFTRSLTGAGKRGSGDKVRPARPTNCDSRPSKMFRRRCRWCGGFDRTKELLLLRHILVEPPSCRSVEDLTGDVLGARARICTRRHGRHC